MYSLYYKYEKSVPTSTLTRSSCRCTVGNFVGRFKLLWNADFVFAFRRRSHTPLDVRQASPLAPCAQHGTIKHGHYIKLENHKILPLRYPTIRPADREHQLDDGTKKTLERTIMSIFHHAVGQPDIGGWGNPTPEPKLIPLLHAKQCQTGAMQKDDATAASTPTGSGQENEYHRRGLHNFPGLAMVRYWIFLLPKNKNIKHKKTNSIVRTCLERCRTRTMVMGENGTGGAGGKGKNKDPCDGRNNGE